MVKMAGRRNATSHRVNHGDPELCSKARCITHSHGLNDLLQKIEDAFSSASDLRKRQ